MREVQKVQRLSLSLLKTAVLPAALIAASVGAAVFYRMRFQSGLSESADAEVRRYLTTAAIIAVSFAIQRLVGALLEWYRRNIASKTPTRLDDDLVFITRRTFKVILWIVAALLILPLFGINISGLVATLGVSSLAIALAAQDTIANIISGFMIMIDRPFRMGDRIKLASGEVVTVLDIGVRRSKFLSEDKAVVIVPNLELSKSRIVNYTYGEERARRGS